MHHLWGRARELCINYIEEGCKGLWVGKKDYKLGVGKWAQFGLWIWSWFYQGEG